MKNTDNSRLNAWFWSAETSEDQEQELWSALHSGAFEDEELTLYHSLIEEEKKIETQLNIPTPSVLEKQARKEAKEFDLMRKALSVAAGLLLVLGIVALLRNIDNPSSSPKLATTQIENQEEALRIVLSALSEVSGTLETTTSMSTITLEETEAFELLNM